MGNHASTGDRRSKPEHFTGPAKLEGQAFMFDRKIVPQQSEEEPVPVLPSKSTERKDVEELPPVPSRERPIFNRNEKMLPCIIKWTGGGQNVELAGTFNQWEKLPMNKSEKDFIAIVDLPKGNHEYRFIVDGEWKTDLAADKKETDEGIQNNFISVSQSDFEELENTLLKDPNDKKDVQSNIGKPSTTPHNAQDSDDEYSQDIPEPPGNENVRGPPVLPPHLLQVILNKDTPVSIEPTLLPEPNHVMLNHMYALSIKDGLMVLSTSHRYKKKCVTTLIYRPI